MKKYQRYFRKHRLMVIILILFLGVFALYFSLYRFNFQIGFASDLGAWVMKLFSPVSLDYQNITNQQVEALRKENQELSKLLELKNTTSDFQGIVSRVLYRDLDYWFQTMAIDKGEKDGIEKDMAVVDENGLVGKVIEVSAYSSVVRLVSANHEHNKIAVSVKVGENIYNGILEGYDAEEEVLLVTSIRSTSDIQVGSIVETNGLGEVFPSGIYVGEVVAIINDDLGVSKILKVKPKSSLEDIRYVMVLGRGEHH